ncbi:MFS transporter [Streptomyces sp. NPDC050264]|uniref:MFS transporter n=1 Tax=Streptomyces sp. NPDC050264 TaxID=3155038 RepID=UPI003427DA20
MLDRGGRVAGAQVVLDGRLGVLASAALARLSARGVLIVALLVFTIANAGSALAGSYVALLVWRGIAGAGAGLYSPNAATAAAALAPAERRGRAPALVLGGMSGGTVLGVPLGLLLADGQGWRSALWLVTGAGALACATLALRLPEVATGAVPAPRARLSGLTRPRTALVLGVTFTQTVASLGLYSYLELVLHRTAHVTDFTVYLWVWGLGGVCGSFLAGAVADRLGRPALLSGLLLAALALTLAVLPFSGAPPGLVALPLLLWGAVGWAFVVPQQHRLIAADAPGGAAVALNSSATYLGGSVGAALGGLALAGGLGARWLPLLAAIAAAAGLLLHCLSLLLPASARQEPSVTGPRKGTPDEDRRQSPQLRP